MKLTRFNKTHSLKKTVSSGLTVPVLQQPPFKNRTNLRLVHAECWCKSNLNPVRVVDGRVFLNRQEGRFNSFSLEYYSRLAYYESNYFNTRNLSVAKVKAPVFWLHLRSPIFLTSLDVILSSYLNLRAVLSLYISLCTTKQLTPYVSGHHQQGFYERQIFSNFNVRYL